MASCSTTPVPRVRALVDVEAMLVETVRGVESIQADGDINFPTSLKQEEDTSGDMNRA